MQVSTDCTTAVMNALAATREGLTLEALLARLLAYHPAQQACDALEQAVAAGTVAMACPNPGPGLVFRRADPGRPSMLSTAPERVAAALDDIVATLGSRVDNRGDFDSTIGVPALFAAFAGKYDGALLEAALQLALDEALLVVTARPSNCYVTVSLAREVAYSVLAYDCGQEQAWLAHVRAGTAHVAQRKVAAAWPHLKRLALVPGRVDMEPADDQAPLEPHRL